MTNRVALLMGRTEDELEAAEIIALVQRYKRNAEVLRFLKVEPATADDLTELVNEHRPVVVVFGAFGHRGYTSLANTFKTVDFVMWLDGRLNKLMESGNFAPFRKEDEDA